MIDNMNLMHLKYLIEVQKTGSITKAAAGLYMGQPNLSKAIKELENEFGAPIFKRISKGVEPTDKGKEYLECAKAIIQQVEKMEALSKPENTHVLSMSIKVPRASYITFAAAEFIDRLSRTEEIEINFKETNSLETINSIIEGECNIGIIRYESAYEDFFLSLLADKEIAYKEIWSFDYKIVMSKSSPFASKPFVNFVDLEDKVEIVHGDNSVPYLSGSYLKKAFKNETHTKKLFVYERGSQFDFLSKVKSSYMWVSPIPQEMLDQYGLVMKECKDTQKHSKDIIIYPNHYRFTEYDEVFVNHIFSVRDKLMSNKSE